MVDQDLDWMSKGPLSLRDNLHHMPKHPKSCYQSLILTRRQHLKIILTTSTCIYVFLRYTLMNLLVHFPCTL